MSTIGSNAVSGLFNSQTRINQSATKIANAATPEGKDVDTNNEIANIQSAKNDFTANATVLKVERQITEKLLDIMA